MPSDTLTRVVRAPGGGLAVGRDLPGRGAWLCRGSTACLDDAVRRHGFDRAFCSAVDEVELEGLRAALNEAWGDGVPDVRG